LIFAPDETPIELGLAAKGFPIQASQIARANQCDQMRHHPTQSGRPVQPDQPNASAWLRIPSHPTAKTPLAHTTKCDQMRPVEFYHVFFLVEYREACFVRSGFQKL
jgi:hypothetical protein